VKDRDGVVVPELSMSGSATTNALTIDGRQHRGAEERSG
jgi:hypothetical protein